MNLLHIDAGITGEGSVTKQVSAAAVAAARRAVPGLQVVHRDLDADPIPHLGSRHLFGAPDSAEAAAGTVALQEFLDADIVVIGAPMYNFSIPSQLKAWFDRILVAGKTFQYTAEGPKGLAGPKKVVVASARGGFYGPGTPQADLDFHERYIRTLLGFIGVEDVTFVTAEGLAISPEHRQASLDAALASAPMAVAGFARALAA